MPHEHTWTRLASELPEGQQALHVYVRRCHGCGRIDTRVDGDPMSDEGWLPTTQI